MRLRQIETILEEAKENIKAYEATHYSDIQGSIYRLKGLEKLRIGLSLVQMTSLFKNEYEKLRLSSIFGTAYDEVSVSHSEYSIISEAIRTLTNSIDIALETIGISIPSQNYNENVIYVKLPIINDFDDLSGVIDKLKKAIQIPSTLPGIEDQIIISNFDSGSKWFELVCKSSITACFIGSLAWSGAVIYKKYQEAKLAEQHFKNAQLGTEYFEALVAANEKQLNLLIETEAKLLQNEYLKDDDNENLERLKLSVKTMSELIEKGTEIQPALLAPENVSNLFPDYSNIMMIESKQKQIQSASE